MSDLNLSARARLFVSCAAGALLLGNAALAQTWTGGTGVWNVPGNWDTGTVPSATDNAIVDNDAGTDSDVTITDTRSILDLTIAAGDAVTLNSGFQLSLNGGDLVNDGTLMIDGATSTFTTLNLGTDTLFSGTGSVEMLGLNTFNRIIGTTGATLTNDAGHTIRGAGSIGASFIGLDNAGLVEAAGPSGLTLNLRTANDVTRRNTGTLRAAGGSTLSITQGLIDNTAGTIEAALGGTVSFSGGTFIDGGTLTGPGDFDLRGTAELAGVTNDSSITIASGQTGEISGTVVNDGTITLEGAPSTFTTLSIQGDTTLDGTGSVEMLGDNTFNRIIGTLGATLTNTASHAIRGAGSIGASFIGLDNAGLVEAAGPSGLTLNLRTANDVTRRNTGTLRAAGGSTLSITQGLIDNTAGTIEAALGGTVSFSGGTFIDGGTLTGPGDFDLRGTAELAGVTNDSSITIASGQTGEISGTVVNDGTITLEGAPSTFTTLSIQGDTTLDGTGSVEMLGDNTFNRIIGTLGATLTNTASHAIRGAGSIGASFIGLDNEGLVEAVGSSGLTLNLRTANDVTRRNTGTLRAAGGSTLSITQGLIDNTAGTIEAASGGTVSFSGGTFIDGGTLTGPGDFDLRGSAELAGVTNDSSITIASGQAGEISDTVVNNGTITLDGAASTFTTLSIQGDTTLDGTGSVEMLGDNTFNQITGTLDATLTNEAGHTIRGAGRIGANFIGLANAGLIDADGNTALTIDPRDALGPMVNTGILRASGAGGLILNGGQFDNQGLVEAVGGSRVEYTTSGVTLNNAGGVLTGGQWRAAGNGSTIDVRGGQVDTNDAEIILSGPGSTFLAFDGFTPVALEDSLTTNDGILRVLENRDFTAANALTNTGTIELGGGTFDAPSLTNTITAQTFGFGTVVPQIANAGVVRATGGTLTADAGISGDGTVIAEADGGVAIGVDSTAGILDLRGGALALGPHDFTVSGDYTNDAFGVGNGFDARANVSGSGQIIGTAADMGTGGDVVSGVLDLGNVRGGTSVTKSFTVDNTGTGADIRGAVQTAAGTGNITDTRLSGSGVTAQNFGPIAAGDSTGTFEVTFDASTGGDLTGQTIGVVQNFDNVIDQTIVLDGFATQLAQGQAAPAGPVSLGNFRVGIDGPTQSFDVTNLTTGDGAESLGIASANASGNFSGSNDLGALLIAGGATAANAASVAVSSGAAGVNNGNLTLQYLTDGTATDAAFTAVNANSETIDVSATGFNVAQAQVTPDPVVIANQRVGGTNTAALTVANIADAGSFTEGLNASVDGTSGAAQTNGGSIALLSGGGSDNTSISAGVDTTTAGAKSGSVTLNFASDGNGTSELGTLALADQTVQVQGDVFALAEGQLNNTSYNFGTVQVGQTVNQALSISNIATGPAGFVEDLNASFGASSGTGAGQISGSGAINGLLAGATDTSSMSVSVNTASAGTINGAIAVDYFSAAAVAGLSNGLGILGLGSDSFAVSGVIDTTGTVVDQAAPVINTATPVALGNVRIGAVSPSANISVTNQATGNDQAALNATIAGSGAVTAAGSFDLLSPGATDAASLSVGLDTSTAGAISDNATLSFVSDASNIGSCAPNCQMTLASQDVQVTGAVYRLANPLLNTSDVALAARVGDSNPTAAISVTNQSPDIFTEALDANLGTAPTGFTSSGTITGLAAQGTNASNLSVALDTSTAGSVSGDLDVNFTSSGVGTTGAADLALAGGTVGLTGRVYQAAEAELQTGTVDFGIVHVGDAIGPQSVTVANSAATAALNDTLSANFANLPAGAFSGSGNVSGLGAGASSSALQVALDTSSAGVFSQTGDFVSFLSENPDMAALDLGFGNLTLTGQVNNFANPIFAGLTGDGSLTGSGSSFVLDFGTLALGSTVGASFGVLNDVVGPADLVDGNFDLPAGGLFALSGFTSFADLAAEQLFGGLDVSFSASTEGLFSETIELMATGKNASGFSRGFGPISLQLSARVTELAPIPLPAGVWLLLSGLGGLGLLRRRRRAT